MATLKARLKAALTAAFYSALNPEVTPAALSVVPRIALEVVHLIASRIAVTVTSLRIPPGIQHTTAHAIPPGVLPVAVPVLLIVTWRGTGTAALGAVPTAVSRVALAVASTAVS